MRDTTPTPTATTAARAIAPVVLLGLALLSLGCAGTSQAAKAPDVHPGTLAVVSEVPPTPAGPITEPPPHPGLVDTGTTANTAEPINWRKVLAEIPTDPRPPVVTRNTHYVVSNEFSNQVFHRVARPLGGIFVGVGSEQNYVFAGWFRPQALVLLDFDQVIVDLHAAYEAAFATSNGPDELVFLWTKRGSEVMKQRIMEHFATDAETGRRAWRAYKIGRARVSNHLRKTRHRYRSRRVPTFLNDQESFDYIKTLFAQGRVRRVRGNLKGPFTLKGLAGIAKAIDVPISAIYVSNAEDYFKLVPAYRENILALPFAKESLFLRTQARNLRDYWYVIQPGRDFQAWIERGRVRSVKDMLRGHKHCDGRLCRIAGPPVIE